MKTIEETQANHTEEKVRIIRLEQELSFKLSNTYYAEKLNRTQGAISQALNGLPNTTKLLARINRHNNWLEKKIKERKARLLIQKNNLIPENRD